ncbi:MAG: hypothetical protein LC754_13495 [Acidobacteria bacterium]|nr:hypothetical protein [Acidobacteriota bacterium]
MNSQLTKRAALALLLFSLVSSLPATTSTRTHAQGREHLTPEEIEQVREAQELDRRTAVFVKAAERRLLALADPASLAKQSEKDTEKWGTVKGTRTQLLGDLSKILEEAVTNIDDAAQRNPKSPLLQKSLRKLSEAVNRFMPQLTPLRDAAQDIRERETVEEVIERAREIIEADKNHPAEESSEAEKSGKKQPGKKH